MNEIANLWVVKEARKFEPIPIGFYHTLFQGEEDLKLQSGELKWKFSWEVKNGEQAGRPATALTNQDINPNTLAGRLIQGLLGRPLVAGENVQAAVTPCVGQPYMVNVQPGPKGGKAQVQSCGKTPPM